MAHDNETVAKGGAKYQRDEPRGVQHRHRMITKMRNRPEDELIQEWNSPVADCSERHLSIWARVGGTVVTDYVITGPPKCPRAQDGRRRSDQVCKSPRHREWALILHPFSLAARSLKI